MGFNGQVCILLSKIEFEFFSIICFKFVKQIISPVKWLYGDMFIIMVLYEAKKFASPVCIDVNQF